MLEAVREGGMLPPGTPLVAMLSGGRDSVCLLDLAVRLLGAGAVTALHVNYGLRDDSDADEEHCAALCARLGVRLEVERPRRPEGPGNLQAWARDTRYAAAARLALEADGPDRHRPHRRRPGRDDPLPARLLAEPAGAAGDEAARRQAGPAAARLHPRADDRLLRGARAGLARRSRPTPAPPTPATGCATGSPRRSPRSIRRRRRTCCARRSCCATRPRCSTRSSPPSSTARRRGPRHDRARAAGRAAAGAAPARRPAARRPRRRPPGRRRRPPRRGGRRPAPHRHRDARPRRRRPRDRRARRPARRAVDRLAAGERRRRDRRDARLRRGPAAAGRRAGAADQRGLRRVATCSWSAC